MIEKVNFIKIYKSPNRSVYSFRKEQQFFEFIRNFLVDLGFKLFQVGNFGRPFSEKESEYIGDEEEKIEEYIDQLDNFSNDNYSVDIISFADKEIVVINSREDKQKEISEKIERYVDWRE